MRLHKVKIENFRGIKEVEIDLAATTLLIGENNSGKTTVLDAIRLAMSRSVSRKTGAFDQYDYHLNTREAEAQDSAPIGITLVFRPDDGEDLPEEFTQTLGDVLVIDPDSGKSILVFRVTSEFDGTLKDFLTDWHFLDASGNALASKTKRPQVLQDFQRLFPVFYLSALRDAVREFRTGGFWTPFLKNLAIAPDLKEKLQEQVDELNTAVLNAHDSLKSLKVHLAKIQDLVPIGKTGTVDIEALPGRISDLLTGTQVSVSTSSGASIPLIKHGAGTQSLSVLFLFQAYLSAMLEEQFSELSSPLLALEEPEAHLHPFATRSLWSTLDEVSGQKLIASHSGDLVANTPLSSIRRLYRLNGDVKVGVLTLNSLDSDDERKIQYHITTSRGELLFARCWLLCEGETEHWVLDGLARATGRNLDLKGVRIVTYRNSGHGCLLKAANAWGIPWYLLADGDPMGGKSIAGAKGHLNGAKESDRICQLPEDTIELHLCMHGFGTVFETHISRQKQKNVVAKKGTMDYWRQVLEAKDNTPKPMVIQDVVQKVASGTKPPKTILDVLDKALKLAEV